MIAPCPYLDPQVFLYVFLSPVWLKRGEIERLWWAPGDQPGSNPPQGHARLGGADPPKWQPSPGELCEPRHIQDRR